MICEFTKLQALLGLFPELCLRSPLACSEKSETLLKDYINFDGMPVVLFTAIVINKLQYMHLGDWITICTCNAEGKAFGGGIYILSSATNTVVARIKVETA